MKRLILSIAMILFLATSSLAASSIVFSTYRLGSNDSLIVVKAACTAHTDGTFDSKQLTTELNLNYWQYGYFLINAYAVNDATTFPASGAVTITDETGRQLVGSSSYDGVTLTLSTSASGVAFAAIEQVLKMDVTSKLTVAVTDTGAAANVFNLYLVMRRWAGN